MADVVILEVSHDEALIRRTNSIEVLYEILPDAPEGQDALYNLFDGEGKLIAKFKTRNLAIFHAIWLIDRADKIKNGKD